MQKFDSNKTTAYTYYDGFHSRSFICPYCNGLASHDWRYIQMEAFDDDVVGVDKIKESRYVIFARCQGCLKTSVWLTEKLKNTRSDPRTFSGDDSAEILLYPFTTPDLPKANEDMPEDVKRIYDEACLVLKASPRSSAALSRLAIEKLVDYLEADGDNLNLKIADLVSKGLPKRIQQMLDSVRVIGNNAVHPGEIDLSDDTQLALSLLNFINLIVDDRISQPKKIDEVYNGLPESNLKSIEKRDS